VVGSLLAVQAGTETSRLVIRVHPSDVDAIPANVQVRLLPRTVFGQAYVDLVTRPAEHRPTAGRQRAAAGHVRPDDPALPGFHRIYDLLSQLQPAQLDAALSAVAEVLRGRGGELGHHDR